MTAALYRRYRPDSFAEVIGQEHVTVPLMQALRSNRVNHAYLFSGPRGCGKTTSARILARVLNCAQNTPEAPRDTPCGECESCRDLARGGAGSLDVVEIDAASHGGVDDARELRERATFSPSRDRFKIFILDEAHMVTPQGFNALLKIVEEPPEYLKFIFATTEPDKVIGTIRSRTHHYPFRLVPPEVLEPYLEQLCAAEGVTIGAGVLPLVVRAGGGSVRDSLSVMDQLIAGSDGGSVDYELAVALLGYTHATLLDDVVDALAARDGASIFRVIERIINTGHEPRRFVEDLLERLRDLIVIAVSGDGAESVLRSIPADQLARLRTQAGNLGIGELSRAADLVNDALTEMTGATSPRLHLELLCARLLLPAADDGDAGVVARLERLERREGVGQPVAPEALGSVSRVDGGPRDTGRSAGAAAGSAAQVRDAMAQARAARTAPAAPTGTQTTEGAPGVARETPVPDVDGPRERAEGPDAPLPGRPAAGPVESEHPRPPQAAAPTAPEEIAAGEADAPVVAESGMPAASSTQPSGAMDTEVLRRRWPEVLETLSRLKRTTWALVGPNSQVAELGATTLRLSFSSPGLATTFRNGSHAEIVQQAVRETLGFDVRVEGGVDDAAGAPGRGVVAERGDVAREPSARTGSRPSAAEQPPRAGARDRSDPPPPDHEATDREATDREATDRGAAGRETTRGDVTAGSSPRSDVGAGGSPARDAGPARGGGVRPSAPIDAPAEPAPDPADVTWEVAPLGGPAAAPSPAETGAEAQEDDAKPAPADEPGTTGRPGSRPSAAVQHSGASAPQRGTPRGTGSPTSSSAASAVARAAAHVHAPAPTPYDDVPPFDDEPPLDDSVPLEQSSLVGPPLVAQLLGGQVVDEIIDEPEG